MPAKVLGDIVEEGQNMLAKNVMTLETTSHLMVVVILNVFFPLCPVVAQILILVRGIAIKRRGFIMLATLLGWNQRVELMKS